MKVRHPLFPDVIKDVQDVAAWLKAGWLQVEDEVEHLMSWDGKEVATINLTEPSDDSE